MRPTENELRDSAILAVLRTNASTEEAFVLLGIYGPKDVEITIEHIEAVQAKRRKKHET